MPRLVGAFEARRELLDQLLTGPNTAVANLDVLVRTETRKRDQVSGEVHDPNRLAHIENEDLATFAHGASLQHQLARLGNGHEVSRHVGMGHGHGTASRDLLSEDRNHASRRTENVPKANRNESSLRTLRQGLEVALCTALGC